MLLGSLGACSWPFNNPYPPQESGENILYASFAERPKHLDPAVSYSANEYVIIAQIYEPPFQYHYLNRPYALEPLTAAALPQPILLDGDGSVLPDDAPNDQVAQTVYEISIRPGIRYQPHAAFARSDGGELLYHQLPAAQIDGISSPGDLPRSGSRELVAADYVYQIKRLAHPSVHSPIFGVMSSHIVGLGELSERLRQQPAGAWLDLREVAFAGAEVVDRYTYRVRINGRYPQFVFWLAMPFFAPMPWEADRFYAQPGLQQKNITLDWFPVGTGAFYMAQNDPNRRMVLARNPNFHGERYPADGEAEDAAAGLLDDAGRELPFLDRVVFSLEKENIPVWNKFLQGYYDRAGLTSDSFDQAIRLGSGGELRLTDTMRDKGITLRTAVATSTFYTGFNMLDPVVGAMDEAGRKLRRAIAIAIDEEEFISIFQNGRGIAMQGPLPPGIFGYRELPAGLNRYVYELEDDAPRRRDIAEARRLLAEAGYPRGRSAETGAPLVLYFDTPATGPDAKASFDWLRKQFAKIDIQLVIRSTDYNRFQDKMHSGKAQIFQWGWNADYPDPENFLFLFYGPNAKALHRGENASNYQNAEFDALFERMRAMPNTAERQAIIDRMVAMIQRDTPWAAGFHPKLVSLYHAWNHNIKPHTMANNTLKYQRIDPQQRVQARQAWNHPVWWPLALLLALLLAALAPALGVYRRRQQAGG